MVSGEVKVAENENIKKLRELSNKLCEYEGKVNLEDKYRDILLEIKKAVDADNTKTLDRDTKMKRYESICTKIRIMLNKLNFA